MEERGEVMLRGEMYEAPADIDGYLSHVYGDWRTPVFSRDLSDYLSDGFYDKKGGRMRAARRRLEELLSRTRRRERRGR